MDKIAPFIKLLQKAVAKEFLWLIGAGILALPLALFLKSISEANLRGFSFHPYILKEFDHKEELAWAFYYLLSLGGLYISRWVYTSLKLLLLTPKSPAA